MCGADSMCRRARASTSLPSCSKSWSLPRGDASSLSASSGEASAYAARQSVHAAGMSDPLPFGRMTSTSKTPRRLMLLITQSVCPSNA
jgi:hypothetical protein